MKATGSPVRFSGFRPRHALSTVAALLILLVASGSAASAREPRHPLDVDDVLDTIAIDRIAPSPDGEWVAVVQQRPARPGEVFGRNAYEIDPSRNDVWLVSRTTGERRNLTNGASSASGFWCARWSPDGGKLAMLSTRPEGTEPRGGDNVRLYVWDRATATLARMSDAAMMTQTRYGSPIHTLDLRGGADQASVAHLCRDNDENAPFLWLDERRLLATMLPDGQVSALIDAFGRPFDHTAATRRALHDGSGATATAVGSGAERMPGDERTHRAILRIIDTEAGAASTIGEVPTYPFQGALSLVVAPDGRQIAVLATLGAIPPARGQHIPHHDDAWQVEKRLGFLDLAARSAMRWTSRSAEASYPVELLGWSSDSRSVALRARAAFPDTKTALFVASSSSLAIERRGAPLTVGSTEAGPYVHEPAAVWIDTQRMLVRGRVGDAARDDWWLVDAAAPVRNLTTSLAKVPDWFRRSRDGRFVTVIDGSMIALDPQRGLLTPAERTLPADATLLWPRDPDQPADALFLTIPAKSGNTVRRVPLDMAERSSTFAWPAGATLLDVDRRGALWHAATRNGLALNDTRFEDGAARRLLDLDTHLASVAWGRTLVIDYASVDGRPLKAAVILPPGYRAGRRYPTITWVYGGHRVSGVDDYWLDPFLPGVYNLQLYAARGYVVLVPSIPLRHDREKNDSYPDLAGGVMPAIDRLVALGIADPLKIGVMGQSFGGYSVYALVTQTDRFKAAVALAGLTDFAQTHDQFDATARGYPGIEHQMSANWSIVEKGLGLGVPPYEDRARYARNSPLDYVDRVETPLLLIHGEYDRRGAPSQAETFFYSLYRQGKTARLLRYWGESHSLAQSPANVRDVVDETLRWFDNYVRDADLAPD